MEALEALDMAAVLEWAKDVEVREGDADVNLLLDIGMAGIEISECGEPSACTAVAPGAGKREPADGRPMAPTERLVGVA